MLRGLQPRARRFEVSSLDRTPGLDRYGERVRCSDLALDCSHLADELQEESDSGPYGQKEEEEGFFGKFLIELEFGQAPGIGGMVLGISEIEPHTCGVSR